MTFRIFPYSLAVGSAPAPPSAYPRHGQAFGVVLLAANVAVSVTLFVKNIIVNRKLIKASAFSLKKVRR